MIARAARHLAVATLALLLACPAVADAAPTTELQDAAHYFRMAVPADWQPAEPGPGGEEILVAYRQPDGAGLLAVTRTAYPNRRAWRRDPAFFDEVEAGFTAAGLHRERRKIRRLGRVPAMDLELADDRGRVAVRILFFRTFSLVLAIRTDRHRRSLRAARALLRDFEPYFAK